MKRLPYIATLALVLTAACGNIPGLSPPTQTALPPTDTPVPTFTPLPTDTPTATPTATPNWTATAEFRATQSADDVLSELDSWLGDTEVPYQEGHLLWKQSNPAAVRMTSLDQGHVHIGDKLTADNFILKSEVTWEATGLLLCGAIFRSEPNLDVGEQYQFMFMRFSGLPAWTIEVHRFGQFQNTPTKIKFSDALDMDNGATNEFLLVVQDEQFTLYLNRVRQGRYYDYSKQRMDGSMAFLGLQQSGRGSCEFENSWVWALK